MRLKSSYLLLILALLGSKGLLSQTLFNNSSKWTLGLSLAPQFSNWSYTDSEYPSVTDRLDSVFTERNRFSFGITAEYHMNRSSIKSGIRTSIYVFESLKFDVDRISDPAVNFDQLSYTDTEFYLDIPLIYNYSIYSTKKINLFAGAGLINRILMNHNGKSYSYTDGEKKLESSNNSFFEFSDYYLAGSIEAGINVALAESLNLSFSPSFEHSLLNIKESDSFKRQYYQLSLNIGASWNL